MARRSGLSSEDLQIWASYGRSLTRLMPGRVLPPAPPTPPTATAAAATLALPAKPGLAIKPAPLALGASPAGLDKASWKSFSTGKTRAQARLDLHGHTAARAHHEVRHFLIIAHNNGLRCVEIITGNGEILARELPHWLNAPQLRPYILAIAHPNAANTGAVRILLRRQRA